MKLAVLAETHLEKSKYITGSTVQQYFLSKEFSRRGIEVYYFYCQNENENENIEILNGVKMIYIKIPKNIFTPFYQNYLYYKKLIAIKPDWIYVRGRSIFQYTASRYIKIFGGSYIWNTNGWDSAEHWKYLKKLSLSEANFIKKTAILIPTITHDFYINKGMRNSKVIINQTIDQKLSTKKILNVNGKILPNYFPKIDKSLIKKDAILWIANLHKSKRVEKFIELIKQSKIDKWEPIIAGGTADKTYYKKIKKQSRENNITFKGKVKFFDSYKIIKQSKIFINTSDVNADGLSNAFIQSWLSGTVVLSLNHNPNNWMEKHNIGFCANGNFSKLIEKLNILINDKILLESMKKNAIKFAENKFSNEKIIDNYIKIFRENDIKNSNLN